MKVGNKLDFYFQRTPYEIRKLIQADEVAMFSITHQDIADEMSRQLKKYIKDGSITDGTACVGGNTISFCKFFDKVYSFEIDKTRFEMLKNNVEVAFKFKNCVFYNESMMNLDVHKRADMLFMDPPWGGVDYMEEERLDLFIDEIPLYEVCDKFRGKFKNIAIKVPKNFNIRKFRENLHEYSIDTVVKYKKFDMVIICENPDV